jgi:hypothetical protein
MENITRFEDFLNEADENGNFVRIQGGGPGSLDLGRMPASEQTKWFKRIVNNGILMDANMFRNGVDKIDPNGDIFKKSIDALKLVISKSNPNSKIKIDLTGGASAVGSPSYNNEALADRRANNYIEELKRALGKDFPKLEINKKSTVGKSTVKDSPEANAEQFVKIKFDDPKELIDFSYSQKSAIDNTATGTKVKNIGDLKPIQPTPGVEYSQMNLIIRYPKGSHDDVYLEVYNALNKKGAYILKEVK